MFKEIFEIPSFDEWKNVAAKSLKLNTSEEVDTYLKDISIEELEINAFSENKDEQTYLNTFPTNRILARQITAGQVGVEQSEPGIDYVFTTEPQILTKSQKLIQVVKDKTATLFGDEVLIDIFSLLKIFEYDSNKLGEYLEKMAKKESVHLLIDSGSLHNAGATITNELSMSLHLALRFVEPFIENKRKICFMTSVDSSYFTQIAKLRALRFLVESIFEKCKISNEQIMIISQSSLREMTLYDPWTNMLRISAHVSSSIVGGADVIMPRCFDCLNQVYAMKESSSLALRHSRNVFHVLMEESHLARVNDPTRGAVAIESLTKQIIDKTFLALKELNQQKSLLFILERTALAAQKKSIQRQEQVHQRKKTICGVNNFAVADEKISDLFTIKKIEGHLQTNTLFPLRRDTEKFEELRLKVEEMALRQKVLILTYGDLKKINARISFCQNYFEVLGLEVEVKACTESMTVDLESYLAIVYCALDENYDELFNMISLAKSVQKFVAGNKYKKTGMKNIYQGQNIYEVLQGFWEGLNKR